ncbi:MAG TPA: hypothetical protein VFD32_09100 [Dehalococcoidia bacterium]|nr:hypothetical protein [Dehalococcoidia bacterium]
MNAFLMRSRDLAWWLAPLVALLALAASMMDMAHGADAPAAQAAVAKPVVPELLPEYNIGGGPESRSETVNRTLFNPTRRPAPTPVQEAPKAQMQRGQFVLTGTTVVDGKATAFLREVKTGKSRRVTQGESLNGMSVTEVKPDRVKLTMGDESEEVTLKVIANPRSTPGAPPPPMVAGGAPAGSPGAPGVPQSGVIVDGPGVGQTPEQMAQQLLERRRAARARGDPTSPPVAPGPAGAPQANVNGGANAPAAAAQGTPATWADVFRQYQQRSGVAPQR